MSFAPSTRSNPTPPPSNSPAQNLLIKMLSANPTDRIHSMKEVLSHPFFGSTNNDSQLTLINAKLQKEAEIRIQTPEENFREDEHNLESDPVTGFPVCESIDFSAASTESNSASPNCCCTPRARRVVNAGLGVAQMFGVPAPRIPPQLLSKASLKPSPPWTKVPQLPSLS